MTVKEMIAELAKCRAQGYDEAIVTSEGFNVNTVGLVDGNVQISYDKPTINTEELPMNHHSMPVLPVTVDAHGSHGFDDHGGLEGKDASFLTGLHINQGLQRNQDAIHDNGRDSVVQSLTAKFDNAIQTLETKFQLERSAKENAIQAERLARDNFAQMSAMRAELQLLIQSENDRTRDLIRSLDGKRKDDDMLVLRIGQLLPTTPATP